MGVSPTTTRRTERRRLIQPTKKSSWWLSYMLPSCYDYAIILLLYWYIGSSQDDVVMLVSAHPHPLNQSINDNDDNNDDDTLVLEEAQDLAVLRTTLILYVPVLFIIVIVFCMVRQWYPKVYAVRSGVVPRLYHPFAATSHGYINWMWKIMKVSESDLLLNCCCSLDAICLLRILRMGRYLSCVGIVCSWFLIPLYYQTSAPDVDISNNSTTVQDDNVYNDNGDNYSNNNNYTRSDIYVRTTTTALDNGSNRYIATVLASYIVFGAFMYWIYTELQWFTIQHEQHLTKRTAQNYTIYVSGIPSHYRSNTALLQYFQQVVSSDAVYATHLVLDIPKLNAATMRYTHLQLLLDRAIRRKELAGDGVEPMITRLQKLDHALQLPTTTTTTPAVAGVLHRIPAIEYYQDQLTEIRHTIHILRTLIDQKQQTQVVKNNMSSSNSIQRECNESNCSTSLHPLEEQCPNPVKLPATTFDAAAPPPPSHTAVLPIYASTSIAVGSISVDKKDHPTSANAFVGETTTTTPYHDDETVPSQDHQQPREQELVLETANEAFAHALSDRDEDDVEVEYRNSSAASNDSGIVELAANYDSTVAPTTTTTPVSTDAQSRGIVNVVSKAAMAIGLVPDMEGEGKPVDVAFVTFSKLSAVTVALQVVHSKVPFAMDVVRAPAPEEIFWYNVGRKHTSIQTGKLLSFAITTAICIFWTVPVTLLVSLTELKALQAKFSFLNEWLAAAPWLEGVLSQIAPLLLSFMNAVILPLVLRSVSRLEGLLGISQLEASLFTKLATFHIFQTILVASLTGSITSSLSQVDEWSDIFRHLANSLPPQAVFFMQLILISTTIGLGCEMLRTTAILQSFARHRLGPNVTERDKGVPFIGLRPLCNPRNFLYAQVLASASLHFMILFTFATLSPVICYVLFFCFLFLEVGYRHQFIYIYPPTPDSGGQMWITFVKIALVCMPIAECILLSYMALARANTEFAMLIPLIVVSVLFIVYIHQKHFTVARYLSSMTCIEQDRQEQAQQPGGTTGDADPNDFLKDKYLQPALLPEQERTDRMVREMNFGRSSGREE